MYKSLLTTSNDFLVHIFHDEITSLNVMSLMLTISYYQLKDVSFVISMIKILFLIINIVDTK